MTLSLVSAPAPAAFGFRAMDALHQGIHLSRDDIHQRAFILSEKRAVSLEHSVGSNINWLQYCVRLRKPALGAVEAAVKFGQSSCVVHSFSLLFGFQFNVVVQA